MLTATERKALTYSTFAAACICYAPFEFVSGTMLLIASAVLYYRDQKLDAQEPAKTAASSTP